MPVQYSLSEKGNPSDQTAPKKFYANAKSTGEVTAKRLQAALLQ